MTEQKAEGDAVEFTGGLRYGRGYYLAINISRPFVRFSINSKSLKIRTPYFDSYAFLKDEPLRLSDYSGFFLRLRMEHSNSEYPTFMVFWTSELEKLKRALADHGYHVENE